MTSVVAIDIEMTGLDPRTDSIIEIGAVRFNRNRIEGEWTSLIKPNIPIPPMITQLTGISNEMVRNAPPIRAILQELVDFVGDDPIVAQNLRSDLLFLQKHKIFLENDRIDTFEMAAVLLPTASRYNLGALCQLIGSLPPGDAHRALTDAQMTHSLFNYLYEKAKTLPIDLIAEFVRLSEPFDWDASWVFGQILREKTRQPISARKVQHQESQAGELFSNVEGGVPAYIKPIDPPIPLDPEEVASVLEYGGPFSQFFENYEYRPQQVEMIKVIAEALSSGQHLMAEAGTGTGKSFAYLVPAAYWALRNNDRVIISTNTINLQEQLVKKDIPDLCSALNLPLRYSVLKGRANYLCPRRLDGLRQRTPANADEMRVLAKVLVWLLEGGSGDRGEITLNMPSDRDIWLRISAENEGCRAEVCAGRMGGACPFFKAHQAAMNAHLLIVNHALLLADVSTGSRVLPDYSHVIIDEAHHLENATTSALSSRITQDDITRMLHELGGTNSGILGRSSIAIRGILRPSDTAEFNNTIERATDLLFRLEHDFKQFFFAFNQFVEELRENRTGNNMYSIQERILPATRSQPAWTDIEIAWDQCNDTQKLLINLLTIILKSLTELSDIAPETIEEIRDNLSDVLRRMVESQTHLNALVSNPDNRNIYWAEVQPNTNKFALNIAPLHIGSLMEKYLWHEKTSVILTSATLTAHGEFDYLRSRLSAETANELALGSPFDYENSALLYLANDIPEPSDTTNYQKAVENTLTRLSIATNGRLLALFTSYAQLKRTSQAIAPALLDSNIQIYEQGEGASPNTLLENFRTADRAVLLGTRSFWEGVDIPGEALSVLVIVKIPFDVPSDPIVAARSETFEDPFSEYNLPEAILRFRQGFGRLIRKQSDRGVVVILDKRIISKRYGKNFIESLPTCKLHIGSIRDIPAVASRWLNL